jgi:uncharacterized membrane protein YccC
MATGVLRIAGAAALAYLACQHLLHTAQPVTGALTALLVVQATLFATVATGARRVGAVVVGVLIAVGFSVVLGFNAASLGLVVASSLAAGKVLGLKDQEAEVAVSAMLILAVSGSEQAAEGRVLETLIGAFVGALVNALFPPRPTGLEATWAVQRVGEQLAGILDVAAEKLAAPVPSADVRHWGEQVRALTPTTLEAESAIDQLVRSRRLNPWSLNRADTSVPLRNGLMALEHVTVAARGLFAAMADDLPELASGARKASYAPAGSTPTKAAAGDLRAAFAMALIAAADGVRAFSDLVVAECHLQAGGTSASAQLTLATLERARARLADLLLSDATEDQWLARTPVVAGVERILRELDAHEWDRRHQQWRAEQAARTSPLAEALGRLRESPLPAWMLRD